MHKLRRTVDAFALGGLHILIWFKRDMATKTTLNARNLESLGTERLVELLLEISQGDAGVKRRLRLALAAAQSPADLAKEVRKRLSIIARSQSFVNWSGLRSLAADLDTQRGRLEQEQV